MTTFALFLVRNDKTGLIERYEIVEARDLEPRRFAERCIAFTDRLTAEYPLETYDVSSVKYDSFAAMSHHRPELKLEEANLIRWD
jgi:hypothetical protein